MTEIKWIWAEDGKSIEVQGKKFEVLPGSLQELAEFSELYDEAKWVFSRLHLGDTSYQRGIADYADDDVVGQLKGLRRGIRQASAELRQAVGNFGAFFKPTDIIDGFADDGAAQSKFVMETIQRLSAITAEKAKQGKKE